MAEPLQHHTPKNILVTGGCGFIGSHMVIHLARKYPQYNIINLDKLDYCASVKHMDCLKDNSNYFFVKGDICSTDLVMYVMKTHKIDTVMHFAAQSHVDNSFGNSIEFTKNNIVGTHALLECAKISDVKLFVHISTDEVYGETAYDKEGAGESALLQPTNPYAASKAGAEHLVNSYFKSFKFPVILTRSNNIFGPHQYPEKVIPKFVCLLERQKPCCLHGNGETKRSFLYVTDVVEAYDTILHKGVPGDVYNIPSSNEISMKDLALQLIKLYGLDESKYIQYVRDRAFNDVRYNIDGAKVAALGWAPKVAFEDGLAKTVEYYKNIDINDIWSRADLALAAHPDIKLS